MQGIKQEIHSKSNYLNINKMNKGIILLTAIFLLHLWESGRVIAGNKDRIGQAGASEMLINPWTRSSGLAGANTASAMGIESVHLNVAGLALTRKTEVIFSRTNWLKGSEININTLGAALRVGESSVLGMGVMAMNFGDLEITTVNLPEGGSGTFSPQFLSPFVSFSREFSNSINGGISLKGISESISNVSAKGIAFDMGVRYITGQKQNIKFGIALRNLGPKMKFAGDGMSVKVYDVNTGSDFTLEQRTEGFELPAFLSIGAAYDLYFNPQTDSATKEIKADHKLTFCGDFQANSFGKDQIKFGLEYSFMSYFVLRGGYNYEELEEGETKTNVFTGPTAGLSIQMPMGANKSIIGLDYSYQSTFPFDGSHSLGIRITI